MLKEKFNSKSLVDLYSDDMMQGEEHNSELTMKGTLIWRELALAAGAN